MNREWKHSYLSTACLHQEHNYCKRSVGENHLGETWTKDPGKCKFCNALCVCACHREVNRADGDR